MRQAIVKMVAVLCMILAAPARGDGPPAATESPITRARRLIQAGDRATALTILEDALIDGPAGDRLAVVDLLRQSYEAMAREAEASGRVNDAAQYRDNLSILQRAHESPRPDPAPTPRVEPAPPKPRVEPAPPKPRVEPVPSGPPSLQVPTPDPNLSVPAPLPEPAKVPKPAPIPKLPSAAAGQPMTRVPRSNASIAPDGTRVGPTDPPPASVPGALEGGEALNNPGDATVATSPARPGAGLPPPLRGNTDGSDSRSSATRAAAIASDLSLADRLFREQHYDESGRIYAAIAARNLLPKERWPHWAYCRFKAVVNRINARPRSAREWDEIEAEVRSIQRLTPGNWYGDYLIKKVAEARHTRRRPAASSDGLVVRGSAPDDPSPQIQPQPENPGQAPAPGRRRPGLRGRSRGTSTPPAQATNPAEGLPASTPDDQPADDKSPVEPHSDDQPLNLPGNLSGPGGESELGPGSIATLKDEPGARSPLEVASDGGTGPGSSSATSNPSATIEWQVHETPSFRIHHCDPVLAQRAAEVAEAVRTAQAKKWGGLATRAPWSPRCDLFLYPTARSYAEATGQPEQSPGLSTMSNNGVRVLSRRMSLRANNPVLLSTTLPHEVTHIVLADLFVAQPIPRWADEGIAVLAEPATEQRLRQADLKEPLDAGGVFKVGQLMTMDYPDAKDWRLFYAQSVSLTLYLVEQGPPERFVQFVRDSQRMGAEAALRDVYHIEGLGTLHERWLDYARKHVALDVATSRDPDSSAGDMVRE